MPLSSRLAGAAAAEAVSEAPGAAAPVATAVNRVHKFLSDKDLATVNQNRVTDILRGQREHGYKYSAPKSATRQRLTDTRKQDYQAAMIAVTNLKNPGRNPWDNFTHELKYLAHSIDKSAVLINAYGEYVSKKIRASFSVTDAPIRKPGTGMKKKNDYDLEVGEVGPKSAGIGLPTNKGDPGKSLKPCSMLRFSLDNEPKFKIWLGKTMLLFVVQKSGLKDSGFGVFAARHYNKGDVIGVYAGLDITSRRVKRNEYARQFGVGDEEDERTVQPDNDEFFFMGMHMINDPQQNKQYNVWVDRNLLVVAIEEINEGEELFLKGTSSNKEPVIQAETKDGDDEPEDSAEKKHGRPSEEDSPCSEEDSPRKLLLPLLMPLKLPLLMMVLLLLHMNIHLVTAVLDIQTYG